MNKDKIRETMELHQKGKDGKKRLFFAAALAAVFAAVAGAVYGAFRLGRKQGARDEAQRAEEQRRAERERRAAEKRRAQREAQRPVYVVHPLPSKKEESGAKRFRRHLCAAVSAVLVFSMVGSSTLPYIEPATVLAKESFSGIGKIVEEHEEEPYRILDIVPADAMYYYTPTSTAAGGTAGGTAEVKGTYPFRLGTMGYLVSGQADLQADLADAFQKDLAGETPNFAEREDREDLFSKVAGSAAPFGLTYDEVYGGVGGVSTAGYTLIYDPSGVKTISALDESGFSPLVETKESGQNGADNTENSGGAGDTESSDGGTGTNAPENGGGTGDGDTEDSENDENDTGNSGDGTGAAGSEDENGDTGNSADTGNDTENSGDGTENETESEGAGGNQNFMTLGVPRGASGPTEDPGAVVGEFHGRYDKVAAGEVGDYTPVNGTPGTLSFRTMDNAVGVGALARYSYQGEGAPWHVTFQKSRVATGEPGEPGGYVVNVLGLMAEDGHRSEYATDMTGVYYYHEDEGYFSYAGTVADILGRTYTLVGGSQEDEGEQEEEKKEEQTGQTTPPAEPVAPPTEPVAPPTEPTTPPTEPVTPPEGAGGSEGESGGSEGESGVDPSEGQTDPSEQGGDGEEGGGDNEEGAGGGEGGGSQDNGEGGGGTEPGQDPPAEPASNGGNEELLSARALLKKDGWYLLVENEIGGDPGTISGDPNTTGGDSDTTGGDSNTTGGDPDMTGGDPADGSGEPNGESGDNNEGDNSGGEGSQNNGDPSGGQPASSPAQNGGETGSYVMDGTPDEAIDWTNPEYGKLMICSFTYVEQPEAGVTLYEVLGEEEVVDAPNLPKPFDAYIMGGNSGISTLSAPFGTLGLPRQSGSGTTQSFVYNPGQGTYKLTYDPNSSTTIRVTGAPVYMRCKSNNDWLKQYVFSALDGGDNESDDFRIEVTTVRADQVKASDIQDADLVFLESADSNPVLNTSAMQMRYISRDEKDAYEDMPEAAMSEILREAADDLKPVIVDYGIVESSEHYKDSNYQHLARALLKRDLAEFVEEMDAEDDFIDNVGMNLGDTDDFPEKDDNDYNYVNQNIYVINGSTLVSDDFHDKMDNDEARAGFGDVLSAIKAENTTLSEDDRISEWVSKARAVQYIINFSVGIIGDFSRLSILELQPSANLKSDFTLEDENTKLLWKTEDMRTAKQILFSKDSIDAQIDTKSVAEFNSEWADINGAYDMVFIGLDGQRLNRDEEGRTHYNNEDLNGKVYHTGDDSGVGTYDANDLTAQKMDDLLHYMAAGYPVLVENDCFEEGTAQKADRDDVNTDYIQEGTVMYQFLQAAVSDDRYEDCIFTVADAMSNSMFMTRVRIDKPRISLVDENGEETSAVQTLARDENDEYHGRLYYRIRDNHGDDYLGDTVVNVYADYNHDGNFVPSELVTEYINQGNMLDVKIDGMGPGILPWKIEVSDVGNEYRRASVKGYFEMGSDSADELKVLQITEKKNDTGMDLQLIFNKKKDSVLAHYLRGAEEILNAEWQIESVSASQLEEKLSENANYLAQWDVVVLTLDEAADNGAVTEALNRYVGEGRSLLVCGQDPGDQRAGLSGALLGQTDSYSFVGLGGRGASGYHRYDGLDSGMYEAKTLLEAEPVNAGSISFYPYVMDDRFSFGEEGLLRAAPYLLDFDDNLTSEENASYVTPWYTFGSTDREKSAYGISPRDGRNNYYCYSKGNVVYLAQSQYTYTCDAQSGPDAGAAGSAECRFFVNALVAAYNAGLHNAHINIVAGFSPDAADITSISVPFDETWTTADVETGSAAPDVEGGILGNTVDVYFKFRDNNFAAEKTELLEFYYEDPDGGSEVDIGGETVKATAFGSEVWTVTDNRLVKLGEGETLQPGKIYRIKAPVVTLKNTASLTRGDAAQQERANKADIYIVLHTSFTRSGKPYEIISSDAVSLNRTRLFLLE